MFEVAREVFIGVARSLVVYWLAIPLAIVNSRICLGTFPEYTAWYGQF